ncbi:Aste57867_9062 [Aphanomyces stellatus]|uniref:Aste57867_9062 protein n=1 Tax=Aphanomyces stellatus TaxID=120398 RepID=A0A485KM38_9STRA|nr:hypothetical protein As57867_009026 [Aphanomyces stellatus]VFT85946.1 Aste57867_9062 [Aphanomyces stellatus]
MTTSNWSWLRKLNPFTKFFGANTSSPHRAASQARERRIVFGAFQPLQFPPFESEFVPKPQHPRIVYLEKRTPVTPNVPIQIPAKYAHASVNCVAGKNVPFTRMQAQRKRRRLTVQDTILEVDEEPTSF